MIMAVKKNEIIVASDNNNNANEPVFKRQRNKINSLARALQLEHSLYDRTTAMKLAVISSKINDTKKSIDNLKMDMQEILHQEFLYLFDKDMPLLPK
jgi:hypothetical protein